MRVHLKTLGCRLNEAELESWARDFRRQGYSITNDAREVWVLGERVLEEVGGKDSCWKVFGYQPLEMHA